MELRRLHPDPSLLDSAELFADLGLAARAHEDRPWLVTNFATTADGRATIDGRSGPIGDDGDTEQFRRLRTQVDALLVGTRTLAVERYGRIVRRPELRAAREAIGLAPDPLMALVSRSGALPLEIPLFEDPDATVVVFTTPEAPEPAGCAATVQLVRIDPAELTLTTALRRLRAEHGVRSLLCEGGPTLMSALLHEGLVDELFLTLAPQLAGGGAALTLTSGAPLPEPARLALVWALERAGSLYLRYEIGSEPAGEGSLTA
jgi:riboflavin-specific deaminase-like protein